MLVFEMFFDDQCKFGWEFLEIICENFVFIPFSFSGWEIVGAVEFEVPKFMAYICKLMMMR